MPISSISFPALPPHTALAVDFAAHGDDAEMRLTFQRMHDAEWSERQRRGWELELGKLERDGIIRNHTLSF